MNDATALSEYDAKQLLAGFGVPVSKEKVVATADEAVAAAAEIGHPTVLKLSGAGHVALAALNLNLPQLLGWRDQLKALPTLMREVFYVHSWFISFTCALFGVLSWRFADTFATGSNELGAWFTAGIGLFWSVRLILQWTYYSSRHWRGDGPKTLAHFTLTFVYGGWAALFLTAAAVQT